MNASTIVTFAIGLGGIVVGAGLVTLLQARGTHDTQRAAVLVAAPPSVEAPAPAAAAAPAPDLTLSNRVAALERARTVTVPAAPAATAAEGRQETPDEAHARTLQMKAARDTEFEHEALDGAWARGTQKAFREDLQRLGASIGGELTDVECRTTRCRAKVTWPSYAAASKKWDALLHASYQVNCGRQVFIPTPDDVNASYEATAFFDCTEARTQ
jgi:hypothetical protein